MALDGSGRNSRRRFPLDDLGTSTGDAQVCPATFPTQEGCTVGVGMNVTLEMSVTLFGLFTVLLLVGVNVADRHRNRSLQIVLVAIAIAALVGPLWTLGSHGFSVCGREGPRGTERFIAALAERIS